MMKPLNHSLIAPEQVLFQYDLICLEDCGMDYLPANRTYQDLRVYVASLFEERFPMEIYSLDIISMWGDTFIKIQVTSLTPEMKTFAKAVEDELEELGIGISVLMSDRMHVRTYRLGNLLTAFKQSHPKLTEAILKISRLVGEISRNRSTRRQA